MPRQSFRIFLHEFQGAEQVRVQNRVVTGVPTHDFKFALGMRFEEFTRWLREKNIYYHYNGFARSSQDAFIEN
jgi:hypothetical protein